jgi:hypothetical protein
LPPVDTSGQRSLAADAGANTGVEDQAAADAAIARAKASALITAVEKITDQAKATNAAQAAALQAAATANPHDFWAQYNLAAFQHGAPPVDIDDPTAYNIGQPANVWTVKRTVQHAIMFLDGTFFFWDENKQGGGPTSWDGFRGFSYSGPWHNPDGVSSAFYPPSGWTFQDELCRAGFAEPRSASGAMLLGYRHSRAPGWANAPPGFPTPPPGTVWRHWTLPANGDADYFLIYVGGTPATVPLVGKVLIPPGYEDTVPTASMVPARNLPPPPPAQYWSPTDGERFNWHTLNSRIGLTAAKNTMGNDVRSAPIGTHWEPDSHPSSNVDAEAGDHQLIYDGPLPAIQKVTDLPEGTFSPSGPGGYSRGSKDTLADRGRFWTPLYDGQGMICGFRTQHRPYDLGREVGHLAAPVLTVGGAALMLIPGAQVAAPAVAGAGVAASGAAAGYDLPQFGAPQAGDVKVLANIGDGTGIIGADYDRPGYPLMPAGSQPGAQPTKASGMLALLLLAGAGLFFLL